MFPLDLQCLLHTWYLSVDMQLFWLSPLLLFPLFYYGKKFSWVIVLLLSLSMACTFTVSYINEFSAYSMLMRGSMRQNYDRLIYVSTQSRMAPWLIGVLLAYLLFKNRNKKVKINAVRTFSDFDKNLTLFGCF
jgi:peptidoglycan/LPS O-acetylase OafA/YrhL